MIKPYNNNNNNKTMAWVIDSVGFTTDQAYLYEYDRHNRNNHVGEGWGGRVLKELTRKGGHFGVR